jgi:hypothetical protein
MDYWYNGDSGAVYIMSHAVFAHARMYDSMMREGDALIIPKAVAIHASAGAVCDVVLLVGSVYGWL